MGTGRRTASAAGQAVLASLGVAVLLLLWQASTSIGLVDPFLVGSPLGALREATGLFREGKIWRDVAATMQAMALGVTLAVAVGVPLSILLGRWRPGWVISELPLFILNATPTVALVPPLILILGIGPRSKVALAFVGAVIPIIFNGRTGAASVPDAYVCAARVYGATRLDIFRKVVLPYSLLPLLAGVRLGLGRALIAVLVGELYATQRGLGLWLSRGSAGMNSDLLVFITLFVAVIGMTLITAVSLVERSFSRWRE